MVSNHTSEFFRWANTLVSLLAAHTFELDHIFPIHQAVDKSWLILRPYPLGPSASREFVEKLKKARLGFKCFVRIAH